MSTILFCDFEDKKYLKYKTIVAVTKACSPFNTSLLYFLYGSFLYNSIFIFILKNV